jgi:hypothetical protein
MNSTNRKINIDLRGYAQQIDEKILNKVANRKQPLASMPFYNKKTEPEKLHEEIIIENRYKYLVDSYCGQFNEHKITINPMRVTLNAGVSGMNIIRLESSHKNKLIKLAEKIVRNEFNIDYDEVLFDLELVDMGEITLPNEINTEMVIDQDFVQTNNLDVFKKRTINCLSQGAALKSHYIFHLYHDDFNEIIPGITELYNNALIANDLIYFMFDDDALHINVNSDNDNINAGYCRINFDGEVPVIEAKAINTPILIHEMTKALISLFSIPGIQNMDQNVIDETDFLMGEIWDIRFGPSIWEDFHSIIDEKDYDIKKLIITELFKIDSEEFVKTFMYNVLNNQEEARKYVRYIVKQIRNRIMDYQFDNENDIDLSELGF